MKQVNFNLTMVAIVIAVLTVLVIWTFVWKPLTAKISKGFDFMEKTSVVQEVEEDRY